MLTLNAAQCLGPSVPNVPRSIKINAVSKDDLLGLVKLVHGQDPSWRFVTLSQLIELKESVSKYASAADQLLILKGDDGALQRLVTRSILSDKFF